MENPMNIDDVMRKYRMSIDDVLNVLMGNLQRLKCTGLPTIKAGGASRCVNAALP